MRGWGGRGGQIKARKVGGGLGWGVGVVDAGEEVWAWGRMWGEEGKVVAD